MSHMLFVAETFVFALTSRCTDAFVVCVFLSVLKKVVAIEINLWILIGSRTI